MPTDCDPTDVLPCASNERRASRPAPCSGPSGLQPEAACGAQAQPSTERVRIAPAGLGLDGTAPDTLPAAPGGSETHPRRMPRGERLDCVAGLWLEVHMNSDTLEMRHCFVPLEECLRFHRGYTEADAEAGWRHTIAAHKLVAGPAGEHVSLKAMAAVLIKNAEISYGLHVGGVYWRADETLDVTVDNWAQPAVSAPSALSTDSVRQSNNNKSEAVTAKEIADFEAASQEESVIQSGSRTYSSGLIPMMEELQHK